MIKEEIFEELKYLMSYPEYFDCNKKYSLVVFIHGAGTRSGDTHNLRKNGSFLNLVKHQMRGYIILAPLCSVNNWNEVMAGLIRLVDLVRKQAFIDITRVHLTGNSMGGYGTWELASLRPDWFASIMPVCGGGTKWMAYNLIDLPIRAFHGICDDVVDPVESLEMVKAVNRQGGHADIILFPKLEHNCWDKVYSTEDNYDWLLAFTTNREKSFVEQYLGAYYG